MVVDKDTDDLQMVVLSGRVVVGVGGTRGGGGRCDTQRHHPPESWLASTLFADLCLTGLRS